MNFQINLLLKKKILNIYSNLFIFKKKKIIITKKIQKMKIIKFILLLSIITLTLQKSINLPKKKNSLAHNKKKTLNTSEKKMLKPKKKKKMRKLNTSIKIPQKAEIPQKSHKIKLNKQKQLKTQRKLLQSPKKRFPKKNKQKQKKKTNTKPEQSLQKQKKPRKLLQPEKKITPEKFLENITKKKPSKRDLNEEEDESHFSALKSQIKETLSGGEAQELVEHHSDPKNLLGALLSMETGNLAYAATAPSNYENSKMVLLENKIDGEKSRQAMLVTDREKVGHEIERILGACEEEMGGIKKDAVNLLYGIRGVIAGSNKRQKVGFEEIGELLKGE